MSVAHTVDLFDCVQATVWKALGDEIVKDLKSAKAN